MFSFKFKKTVTKTISMLAFSLFALNNKVAGINYAKVVILGARSSGKSTIQELIKKNYEVPEHTQQLSYHPIAVYYDENGNFTFNKKEAKAKDMDDEVVLSICDTSGEEAHLGCVNEFAHMGTTVIVLLADARNFKDKDKSFEYSESFMNSFFEFSKDNCRKIIILTHAEDVDGKGNKILNKGSRYMVESQLLAIKNFYCGNKTVDTIATLSLSNEYKNPETKIIDLDKYNKPNSNSCVTGQEIPNYKESKAISLQYLPKLERQFNKNDPAQLDEYIKLIMNLIAKSVWKYGIDKLPMSDADSNYHIEAVEKQKVEKVVIGYLSGGLYGGIHKNFFDSPKEREKYVKKYGENDLITTDKVTTTTELKLVAGKAIK